MESIDQYNTGMFNDISVAVDATGQSYYGNSQLWLWNASAKDSTELIAVPLPQEGPVLSCQWVPYPNKPLSFVVIAGKIPPMASTHHGVTGAVTFLFGNNVHRNTFIVSLHGRFVCLAGFGNMPGGMGFWDMNKKKLIPHSMLNVNGTMRLYKYTGEIATDIIHGTILIINQIYYMKHVVFIR
jgi:translation initiation factor 2A